MTCYSGFLRPGVELSWEKPYFEQDSAVLDSGKANDEGLPHYVTSISMLRYGVINPIIIWAEEQPGMYNIYPGRTRYFVWQILSHIDAPIILIDRFGHRVEEHQKHFDQLSLHRETITMDLVYRKDNHEAWPRSPDAPHLTAHETERAIFAQEWNLNGKTWKRAKREHPEQRFPEYYRMLEEQPGLDFYHNDTIKYRWGWNKEVRQRVDITCMKDGMEVLLPHIGITW
jgi:hypothetical protein